MRWPAAVAALLLLPSLAPAHIRETVDVTVSNLDAVVTDAKGNPIRGLAKSEFELTEGGKPREITNLSEISAATAAPPRFILILFDNTTLTLSNRKRATEALKSWMTAHLRPIDRVAVMTVTPSLQTRQPWTQDSRVVLTVIDSVAGESVSLVEQQQRDAEGRIEQLLQRASAAGGASAAVQFDELTQSVRAYAASLMRDSTSALNAIRTSTAYFPPNAQKKVLMIIGEGMPVNPGADLFEYLNNVKTRIESGGGPASLRAGAATASPILEAREFDLRRPLDDVSSAAGRRGVIIYAINPGQNESGTTGKTANDSRVQFATSAGNRAGYVSLVGATGGIAFFGSPPDVALAQVASDLDSYYSLAYLGGAPNAPLALKSRNGYRVRFARAAAPMTADERMRESVLANHIAAPATNDLHIALAADPPVPDGDRRKVHLKVLIPADQLQLDREGEEMVGGFAVYVSSGDDRGAATNVNRQEHQLRIPAQKADVLKGKTITFAVDVVVPSGLTRISVGVLDQRSQQTGFDRLVLGL